jgi:hypothetical protein
MLALFGAPHLDRIIAAYDEASPLADGWRARMFLHQLHPLLINVAPVRRLLPRPGARGGPEHLTRSADQRRCCET